MSVNLRRALAGIGGLLTCAGSVYFAVFAGAPLAHIQRSAFGELAAAIMSPQLDLGPCSTFSFLGLSVAAGLAVMLIFWNGQVKFSRNTLALAISLLVLLPLSAVNFNSDYLLPRSAEVVLNAMIVMWGAIAIFCILNQETLPGAAIVLRFGLMLLLMFEGICLPGIWALVWAFSAQRLMTVGYIGLLSSRGWMPAVAAVTSVVMTSVACMRAAAVDREGRVRRCSGPANLG